MPAARAASHAGVWLGQPFCGSSKAFLAGRRAVVRDEDDVMPVLAGKTLDPTVPKFADPLPSLLANDLASGGDIGGHLWNISGVLAKCGFHRGDPLAHVAEEVLIAVEPGLVGLAIASMVAVTICGEIGQFVDNDVSERGVAAVITLAHH